MPTSGGRRKGPTFLSRAAFLEGFGREPITTDTFAPSPPNTSEERGPRRVCRRFLEALGEDARLPPPPRHETNGGRKREQTTRTRHTPTERGHKSGGVWGWVGVGRVAWERQDRGGGCREGCGGLLCGAREVSGLTCFCLFADLVCRRWYFWGAGRGGSYLALNADGFRDETTS